MDALRRSTDLSWPLEGGDAVSNVKEIEDKEREGIKAPPRKAKRESHPTRFFGDEDRMTVGKEKSPNPTEEFQETENFDFEADEPIDDENFNYEAEDDLEEEEEDFAKGVFRAQERAEEAVQIEDFLKQTVMVRCERYNANLTATGCSRKKASLPPRMKTSAVPDEENVQNHPCFGCVGPILVNWPSDRPPILLKQQEKRPVIVHPRNESSIAPTMVRFRRDDFFDRDRDERIHVWPRGMTLGSPKEPSDFFEGDEPAEFEDDQSFARPGGRAGSGGFGRPGGASARGKGADAKAKLGGRSASIDDTEEGFRPEETEDGEPFEETEEIEAFADEEISLPLPRFADKGRASTKAEKALRSPKLPLLKGPAFALEEELDEDLLLEDRTEDEEEFEPEEEEEESKPKVRPLAKDIGKAPAPGRSASLAKVAAKPEPKAALLKPSKLPSLFEEEEEESKPKAPAKGKRPSLPPPVLAPPPPPPAAEKPKRGKPEPVIEEPEDEDELEDEIDELEAEEESESDDDLDEIEEDSESDDDLDEIEEDSDEEVPETPLQADGSHAPCTVCKKDYSPKHWRGDICNSCYARRLRERKKAQQVKERKPKQAAETGHPPCTVCKKEYSPKHWRGDICNSCYARRLREKKKVKKKPLAKSR